MHNEPLVLKRFGKALICMKNNENALSQCWAYLKTDKFCQESCVQN